MMNEGLSFDKHSEVKNWNLLKYKKTKTSIGMPHFVIFWIVTHWPSQETTNHKTTKYVFTFCFCFVLTWQKAMPAVRPASNLYAKHLQALTSYLEYRQSGGECYVRDLAK